MDARKMLFAAILSICALSSKKISIYNEEMIVALCFIGFIIFSRKSLGTTFKATLDGRIQAIQEESQQFPNPNEVVPPESNEQQRLLRISLRICGTVVESLPMARCAPKCEKTVQALLCRNLNVKSATLTNATSSRRIRFQDDLVTKFYTLVEEYAASLLATDALESISAVVLSAQPVAGLVCVVNGFGGIRYLRAWDLIHSIGNDPQRRHLSRFCDSASSYKGLLAHHSTSTGRGFLLVHFGGNKSSSFLSEGEKDASFGSLGSVPVRLSREGSELHIVKRVFDEHEGFDEKEDLHLK
ncbi:hypothetical protein YC2023_045177 [Brassica napus]